MDAMFDMGLTVAQDVDGDGKYSDGDVVGIAAHAGSLYVNFMNGAGQFVGTRDENDKITIDMNNERMISIVEKLCGYMIQPCAAVDTPESSWDDPFGMLGGKLARDEDSVAMLDLVFASFVYDPGLNLMGSKSGVSNLVWTMNTLVVGQKSTDFASYYAKNEKAALASIEAFYEAMDKLDS